MSARATARGALLDAMVRTSHVTGLRAGPASEQLLEALLEAVTDRPTAWAFEELAREAREEGALS